MTRGARLDLKQREEVALFIQRSKDSKEIRRSQSVVLVDQRVDYDTISRLTGVKERSVVIVR